MTPSPTKPSAPKGKIAITDIVKHALGFHKKNKTRISTTEFMLDGFHIIILIEPEKP